MIVTGGHLRGRKLPVPPGERVRPTPARVKEALFSILAPRLDDAVVLDCFAGSGALGIEAISRGAAFAAFIEADARTADTLRATLETFKIRASSHVYRGRAETLAPTIEHCFTLVFADPPYAQPPPIRLFIDLLDRGRLAADAMLIYEHAVGTPLPEFTGFTTIRSEHWGEVGMVFLSPSAKDA